MKIWSLVGGVWVVRDVTLMTATVVSAIKNRPRLEILIQPARSDKDFEIIATNTAKRRAKIKKVWIELSDGSQVFPDKAWANMSISIETGESVTIKGPIKSIHKQIVDKPIHSDIRFIGIEDDNGKLHRVKVPKGIKEKFSN